jgi:hypothetical protein
MQIASKGTKTFSLDRDILQEVKRTKGDLSESARVNHLLRLALDLERRAALDQEAANFFRSSPADRKERTAYEAASLAAWTRD